MIATRAECGTNEGIRWHTAKREPMCTLCTDHAEERALANERHTSRAIAPTELEANLQAAIRALARMLDDHDRARRTPPPTPTAKAKPKSTRYDTSHPRTPCARCGILRHVRPDRPNSGLCRDCRSVDPMWGAA